MHKPALDGIGYQDLVTGKLAWWDDFYLNGTSQLLVQYSAGKQPAWLDYMTNTNKIHGEFAIATSEQFMVLDRNYEFEYGLVLQLDLEYRLDSFHVHLTYQELQQPQ